MQHHCACSELEKSKWNWPLQRGISECDRASDDCACHTNSSKLLVFMKPIWPLVDGRVCHYSGFDGEVNAILAVGDWARMNTDCEKNICCKWFTWTFRVPYFYWNVSAHSSIMTCSRAVFPNWQAWKCARPRMRVCIIWRLQHGERVLLLLTNATVHWKPLVDSFR